MQKRQEIIFVTGKGGVGKSLIAAGLATAHSKKGRNVLLAEIGETSYYKDFWRLSQVQHAPTRVPLGFDLAIWSSESCLREYVLFYLKMERLYRLFFENKAMRALINVAPGLAEIAILGKITSGIRKVGPELNYDLIVVDCYATGHALALFRAPKGMMDAIGFGPMGHHSRDILQTLRDPSICSYQIVTLLEELPVTETLELRTQLETELGQAASIVVNKFIQPPVTAEELARIESVESYSSVREFASHLNVIATRQTKFSSKLLEIGHNTLQKIPLIFSADPNELVLNAAGALTL